MVGESRPLTDMPLKIALKRFAVIVFEGCKNRGVGL
jgi:hypothetical protein